MSVPARIAIVACFVGLIVMGFALPQRSVWLMGAGAAAAILAGLFFIGRQVLRRSS